MRAHLAWLAASGVQSPPGSIDDGGVHAWIDTTSATRAFLYPGITGYYAGVAADLERREPGQGWIERAERAAQWLERRALTNDGALRGRFHADPEAARRDPFSVENGYVCAFDAAIAGLALLAVHERNGRREHRAAARKMARFLAEKCAGGDGLNAIFDLGSGRPVPPRARWSLHFGPHMAKPAVFLARCARSPGMSDLRAVALTWLDAALARRESGGRFVTDPAAHATDLHPHLYAIEGLIGLACELGRGDLLLYASHSLAWTFANCLATRPIVQRWAPDERHALRGARSDVLAQALRAHELLAWIDPGLATTDERVVERVRAELARHTGENGGVLYGLGEDGVARPHLNAWCTLFTVQAELARADRASGAVFDPLLLWLV